VTARISKDNVAMQKLCERQGFRLTPQENTPIVLAELEL